MADYSAFSEPVAKVYEECVDELLTAMAKHFGVSEVGGGTFDYEVRLLTKMGAIRRECAQIIARRSGYARELAELGIEQSISASVKQMEPYLKRAAQRGLLTAAEVPMEESVRRVLEAYSRQARVQMNLVNTVMLESTEQAMRAYAHDVGRKVNEAQRILNTETGEVILGSKSLQEAVRDGVKKMNRNGLTGFIDHGGHHWSPEAYVRMANQTTCANAANEAVFERNRSYGNDLVSVRVNRTAREKCYPWQGKVLSMDNNSPGTVRGYDGRVYEVTDIKDTSYGLPDGLWGINCHHSPANVFIPGMSDVHGVESMPDEGENARLYALDQEKKKYEREARLYGREKKMLKAAGDEEGAKAAAAKEKRARERARECLVSSGASSGAKKTLGWKERHANRYYEEVRNRAAYSDAKKIAVYTPFTEKAVEEIRQHMFIKIQPLDYGTTYARFAPDYDQAVTWQRLVDGKGTETDILMLKHEYYELTQMRLYGYNYDEAHIKANEKYDWWTAYQKNGKGGKHL